jgi:hypothetical protein
MLGRNLTDFLFPISYLLFPISYFLFPISYRRIWPISAVNNYSTTQWFLVAAQSNKHDDISYSKDLK